MFRSGGGDVAITCLVRAGPRNVAVGGSGGKLEIWDVEAVCTGGAGVSGGGGGGGGMAGLVHRLVRGVFFVSFFTCLMVMTWLGLGGKAVLLWRCFGAFRRCR